MMGQNFNLDLCHLHILLIYSFVLGKYNFPKISIDIYYIIYKNKQERQHQDEKYYGKNISWKIQRFFVTSDILAGVTHPPTSEMHT